MQKHLSEPFMRLLRSLHKVTLVEYTSGFELAREDSSPTIWLCFPSPCYSHQRRSKPHWGCSAPPPLQNTPVDVLWLCTRLQTGLVHPCPLPVALQACRHACQEYRETMPQHGEYNANSKPNRTSTRSAPIDAKRGSGSEKQTKSELMPLRTMMLSSDLTTETK